MLDMEGIGDAEEGGKRGQVRDQRETEGDEGCDPMPGVKMVGGGDFDQAFPAGELRRQPVQQIEAADDESAEQANDRAAEHGEQNPKKTARLRSLREAIVAQPNQHPGNRDDRDQPNDPVEHDGQQRAGDLARSFLDQEIRLYDIASRSAREKLIEEEADHKQDPRAAECSA